MRLIIFWIAICTIQLAAKEVSTTIEVLDELGKPVPQAKVEFTYDKFNHHNSTLPVLTNDKGLSVGKGKSDFEIRASISKLGYYTSLTSGLDPEKYTKLSVTLKRRLQPIAMYAKNVAITLPQAGKIFSYDLEVGDLVAPYGQGKSPDLLLKVNKDHGINHNYSTSLTVSFSNPKDGVLKVEEIGNNLYTSVYKGIQKAPQAGYLNKQSFIIDSKTKYSGTSLLSNYVFRVRTKLDENGEIISAHYGKFNGAFDFSRGAAIRGMKPQVRFTYYLNPTANQLDLEFDPNKNLFLSLDREELVRVP